MPFRKGKLYGVKHFKKGTVRGRADDAGLPRGKTPCLRSTGAL